MTDNENFVLEHDPQESNITLNLVRGLEEYICKVVAKKYKTYDKISAITLIKAALHNSYKLNEEVFKLKLNPEELNNKRSHRITSNVSNERLSKTIEKHINIFLNNSIKKHKKYDLPYKIKKEIPKNKYTKYHIPYFDSIIMLLFFIFQDGRIWNPEKRSDDKNEKNNDKKTINDNERIPTFKENNSCSITAYKYVIQEVFRLFTENTKIDNNSVNCLYEIAQLYRIDKTFQIFKLNRFAKHYEKFLTEENLEQIYNCFKFKYNEVINLKEILEKEIFHNKEFIKLCFKTNHVDPLGIFMAYFEKYLNLYSLSKNLEIAIFDDYGINMKTLTFTKFISFCKMKTEEYFKTLKPYKFSKKYSYGFARYFDTPQIEYNNETESIHNEDESKLNETYEMYNRLTTYHVECYKYSDYDEYPWYNYYFANRERLVKFSTSSQYDNSYLTYLFNTIKEFLPQSLF